MLFRRNLLRRSNLDGNQGIRQAAPARADLQDVEPEIGVSWIARRELIARRLVPRVSMEFSREQISVVLL
jgi:hypothetical protein